MVLTLYRRYRLPIFWTVMLIVYLFAIAPRDEAPSLGGSDKTDHIAAFLVLTLLGRVAYRSRPGWLLVAGLSLFGAFIEFSQAMPFIGRDASVWDWVADSAAILVAMGLAALLEKRFPILFAA